jgi:hypothetical protein
MRAPLFLALLLLLPLAGCLLGREPLIIAASAPKSESAMTVFLVTDLSFFERMRDVQPRYEIYYGDELVYPPAGKGGDFSLDGRAGTAVVPYDHFVVGNGEYDVVVHYGGSSVRTRVHIEKWVDYVWLHPFDRGDVVNVEAALSSATGGRPEDRILARGELILTIRYHGLDGKDDRVVGSASADSRSDQTSTSIAVPKSRLTQGPGYYSFEPLFHNLEARNNVQVGGDPTMANLRPPWNWIYVST